MPDWIAENAFTPFMIGLLFTGVLGSAAYMLQNRSLALAATVVGLASFALIVTERYLVTDRERVEQLLYKVANAVEFNRNDEVLRYMKRGSPAYEAAKHELPTYVFSLCNVLGINELEMDLNAMPNSGKVTFIAFADVKAPTYGHEGFVRREVTLALEKEPGNEWKIVGYSHRHPTGGASLSRNGGR